MNERIRAEVEREFPNIGAAMQEAVAEELRTALADGIGNRFMLTWAARFVRETTV